jgi:hypothetical protein
MMILSQYHIFEPDTINIYSVWYVSCTVGNFFINLPCFHFSHIAVFAGIIINPLFKVKDKNLYLTVLRPMFAGERGEGAGGWGWERQQGAGRVAPHQGILAAGCCNTNNNRY